MQNIKLSVQNKEDINIVSFKGKISLEAIDEITHFLNPFIDEQKTEKLLFEIGEVNYIDSTGVGLFASTYKMLRKQGRLFALCQASPNVEKLLSLTSLSKVIPIFKTEEDAVNALGKEDSYIIN